MPQVTLAGAERATGYAWQLPRNGTMTTISVGNQGASDAESHAYVVWNDASVDRTVAMTVRASNATVAEKALQLPPDAVVRVDVHEPDTYRTTVTVAEGSETVSEVTITDDRGNFDCNAKYVNVALLGDGRVGTSVDETLVACGTTTA